MKNTFNKIQKGFTIIEVMIVLAIAGLIIAVVIVAVPQLQRNQRNSARQADVSRVGTSVQNWVSNNGGKVFDAGTGNANLDAVNKDVGALNQYTITAPADLGTKLAVAACGASSAGSACSPAQAGATVLENIEIVTAAACGTNGAAVGGTTRQFAMLFAAENSSGTTGRCISY
jgi:prepilin-type N-terminal cleavage/methylation domain-containing protein